MAEINTLAVGMDSRGFADGVGTIETGIRRMEQTTRSGFQRMTAMVADGAGRIRDLSRETGNVEGTVKRWGERVGKTAVALMSLNTAMTFNLSHSGRMQQALPGLAQGVGLLDERFGYLDRSVVTAADGIRLMADQQDRAMARSTTFARDTAVAGGAVEDFAECADSAALRTQKMAGALSDLDGSWGRMTQTLQNNLSGVFFNVLDDADNVFEGIIKSWKRMIANMLAEAAVLKVGQWLGPSTGSGSSTAGGMFQGAFANLPWIGSLFGGGTAGAYRGGISPNSNIWDIGSGGNYQQPSRPPFNATPYLAGGALASSFIPASAGGGFGGWLQGGMSGASMGSMAGPWGALAGGILGSAYGGYQSGFYRSTLGRTNLWSSILEGTPFGPIGMIGSMLGLPGIGGGDTEAPNLAVGFRQGAGDKMWFESARHTGDSGWSAAQNQQFRQMVDEYFASIGDVVNVSFQELMSEHVDWEFKTEDVESLQDAFSDVTSKILTTFASELFGPESFLAQPGAIDQIRQGWTKVGEDVEDTIVRVVSSLVEMKGFIGEVDDSIRVLTAARPEVEAFNVASENIEEKLAKVQRQMAATTDPTDVLLYAREIKDLTIEQYELQRSYVEGLVAQLRDLERASYEFNLRLQTKIDSLTGSTDAIGIAASRFADLRNEFLNTTDFDRQIALLGELEQGLDTILSMQSAVHQAEVDRLQNVLAMLEQLRSASEAITEKIFSLTNQGESGYASQAGYYWDRLMSTFHEYQGMNWGQEETLEDRIRLVNEMAGWLDQTVNAVMARWEAHYDGLIASAQTEIENLEAQKSGIAEQISDLNEQKSAIQESYRTQMEALEEQIRAAEQWKRLSESIADQILGMKLDWSNQQDIFERMDIARAEIERVRGLYAGAGSDEERIGYAGQLQNLYGDLLSLGQEAWQRPSPEYQSLYEEVLGGLEALQSAANSNAGDSASLQAELNGLTESMNSELEAIDQQISALNDQAASIDTQIAGYRSDIAGYEAEKAAALASIGAEAAQYYTYIQGEMTKLLDLQDGIEGQLKSEKLALNQLQSDFAGYYELLKTAGSTIYQNEAGAIAGALRIVI
ncbi:MAG: hypothetical protein HY788_08525, partial [Deltaproteobacteria bacterium]|nr:hypothetical protein [Deltaproteobacteria bacterium]